MINTIMCEGASVIVKGSIGLLMTIICCIMSIGVIHAQDPTFSQFNLNQFYYNPAYTGDHKGYQLAATYRTLWPNVPGKVFPGPLSTYYALFDSYLDKASYTAGAGIFGMQNIEGEGALKTSTFGISYAQHLAKIGGRVATLPRIQLSLGFKAYINSLSVNWDKLVFSDQLDLEQGIIGQSSFGQSGMGHRTNFDLDLGLLLKNNFQGKNMWYNEVGFGMAHLLRPSLSMTGPGNEDSKMPRKYVGSYRTTIGFKNNRLFVGGTFLFEKQKDSYELNTGIDVYINPKTGNTLIPLWVSIMNRLSLSPGTANTNAVIGSVKYKGVMGDKTKVVYYVGLSADFPYTGIVMKSKGAYELSVGLIFPKKGNNKFSRCPYETF